MPIREIIAPVSMAQVFVPRYCVWAKDRREGWGHSTYRSQSEHWSGRDGTAQESLAALILHFRIDIFLSFFKKRFYLFIFGERGREGEREEDKHQCVVASHVPPTGGLAHNPGMCPDWESNQRPFGSQACTLSSEPQQPGPY